MYGLAAFFVWRGLGRATVAVFHSNFVNKKPFDVCEFNFAQIYCKLLTLMFSCIMKKTKLVFACIR
jgi:hypothetical protein